MMSTISCTVTNCYYNKSNGCTAQEIKVEGEKAFESRNTCCDTFIEQKPGVMSSQEAPKKNATVLCSACHCVHNEDKKCVATDILVNGKNACCCQETCCSTFRAH